MNTMMNTLFRACLQEWDRFILSPPESPLPTATVPRGADTTLLVSELAAFQPLLGEKRMETGGGAEAAAQGHPWEGV